MGFMVIYKTGDTVEKKDINRITPYRSFEHRKNNVLFLGIGDFFGQPFEDIAESGWEDNPFVTDTICGSVSLVHVEDDVCYFMMDRKGIDALYYYHKKGLFILSDDFWSIVSQIIPSFIDINVDYIRQSLLAQELITGETIIKGLLFVHPGVKAKYDVRYDCLSIEQYTGFKYSNEVKSTTEAVENMDRILSKTMQIIKDNCGDVTYGVGISGGLDSRIISHYALQHHMNLVGFNICVPRPHHFLLSRSVSNAHRIAREFGINYRDVKWKESNIQDKLLFEAEKYPFFSGNAFKYETDNMPDFDILLTGGSGLLVGSMLPSNIDIMNEDELCIALYNLIGLTGATSFRIRVRRVLNYLFGKKMVVDFSPYTSLTNRFISSKDMKMLMNRLQEFVRNRKNKGLKNIDIFEEFFYYNVGFMNRYGAFESLFGTKRAFSIYTPFMLDETLRWTSDMLKDREVLNELIVKKIPEVSDIKSESFYTSPGKRRAGVIRKIFALTEFLIRGNGTAIDQYYLRKKRIRLQFISYLNSKKTEWFRKVFNIQKDFTLKETRGQSERFMARIWSLKTLLDYIETREYEK